MIYHDIPEGFSKRFFCNEQQFSVFFNAKIPKVVMLFNQVLSLDGFTLALSDPVRNTGVISDQDVFFSTHSIDIDVRLLSFT